MADLVQVGLVEIAVETLVRPLGPVRVDVDVDRPDRRAPVVRDPRGCVVVHVIHEMDVGRGARARGRVEADARHLGPGAQGHARDPLLGRAEVRDVAGQRVPRGCRKAVAGGAEVVFPEAVRQVARDLGHREAVRTGAGARTVGRIADLIAARAHGKAIRNQIVGAARRRGESELGMVERARVVAVAHGRAVAVDQGQDRVPQRDPVHLEGVGLPGRQPHRDPVAVVVGPDAALEDIALAQHIGGAAARGRIRAFANGGLKWRMIEGEGGGRMAPERCSSQSRAPVKRGGGGPRQ